MNTTINSNNLLIYIVRCNETRDALDWAGETVDLAVFETRADAEAYMQQFLDREYVPGTFSDIELVEDDDYNIEIYAIKHDGTEIKLWIEERVMYDYGGAIS